MPDFQQIALPLLALGSDNQELRLSNVIEMLAQHFGLTQEERAELLPSAKQTRFANRVGWARTHLVKAGLLEATGHGVFRITARGREMLATKPRAIGVKDLERYPEYLAFRSSVRKERETVELAVSEQTPDELMQGSYQQLRESLAQDLLKQIKERSPEFFENLVVDLIVRMGYGGSRGEAGKRIGRTGDGGIDGVIKEDKLGLDVVCLQAKRWDASVGRPVVQAFAGSLDGYRAKKGVLITTSQFTADAIQYVGTIEKRIVLIDGQQLCEYMIEHDVGVVEVANYSVKRIALDELDYFEEIGQTAVPEN